MFKKVVFKNFRSNLSRYMLYFLGIVMSIAIMITFAWMKEFAVGLKRAGVFPDVTGIVRPFANYYLLMAVVTVIFISYIMKEYIKLRIKDYQLFMILGIRKKMMIWAIALEYMVIWAISCLLGTGAGMALIVGLKRILMEKRLWFPETEIHSFRIVLTALMWSLLIFIVVFVYQSALLERRGLSEKESQSRQKERVCVRPWWKLCAVMGIVLIVTGVSLHIDKNHSRALWFPAIFISISGVYLAFSYGLGIWLDFMKNHSNGYYKNILKLNSFYEHYVKNKTIIFVLFTIDFMILYVISIDILDNIAADYTPNYPYAYVVAGDIKEEQMEIAGIQDEIKISYLPVKVSDGQGGSFDAEYGDSFIGISQNDYEKMSGREADLAENQAFALSQRDESDNYIDILPNTPHLYVDGQYEEAEFTNQRAEILFWGYESGTDVIVFSKTMFEKLANETGVTETLWAFNGSKEQAEQIVGSLGKIEDGNPEIRVLYREKAVNLADMQSLLTVIMNIAVGLFLTMNGLLVLSIKLFTEVADQKARYRFLDKLGMRKREQKKNLEQETVPVLVLPLTAAMLLGGAFLFADMFPNNLGRDNLCLLGIYFACCIVPEILYLCVLKAKVVREVLVK